MLHLIRSAAAVTLLLGAAALAANAQTTTIPASPAAPSPTPIPLPVNPPENPLITARVTQEFLAWQRGKIDRKTYSPPAGGTYDDALIDVIAPDLREIGPPQTTTYRTASLLLGDLVYRYDITGSKGAVSVLYTLNQAGKIDGIAFTPLIFRAAPASPEPASSGGAPSSQSTPAPASPLPSPTP